MNTIRLLVLGIMLYSFGASAQAPAPVIRNAATTNGVMNAPSDGQVMVWNAAAKMWSNAPVSATATNAQPPSATLTNLSNTGAITNNNEGNTLFVRTNGNDSTAIRGRPDKPFLTPTNVNMFAIPGDTVEFGSGVFDCNTNLFHFKHGVKYKGQGMGITTLRGVMTNGFIQFLMGDSSISDFTINTRVPGPFFSLMIGWDEGDYPGYVGTNFYANRIHFDGESDCIYYQGFSDIVARTFNFRDCKFTSGYDLVYVGGGGETNKKFNFSYCDFTADLTSRTNTSNANRLTKWITVGYGGGGANMLFDHCTYKVVNALYSYIIELGDDEGSYPAIYKYFEFNNCTVYQQVTNGGLAVGALLANFAAPSTEGTNNAMIFNNVVPVTYATNAPIYTNSLWPAIINMT